MKFMESLLYRVGRLPITCMKQEAYTEEEKKKIRKRRNNTGKSKTIKVKHTWKRRSYIKKINIVY